MGFLTSYKFLFFSGDFIIMNWIYSVAACNPPDRQRLRRVHCLTRLCPDGSMSAAVESMFNQATLVRSNNPPPPLN